MHSFCAKRYSGIKTPLLSNERISFLYNVVCVEPKTASLSTAAPLCLSQWRFDFFRKAFIYRSCKSPNSVSLTVVRSIKHFKPQKSYKAYMKNLLNANTSSVTVRKTLTWHHFIIESFMLHISLKYLKKKKKKKHPWLQVHLIITFTGTQLSTLKTKVVASASSKTFSHGSVIHTSCQISSSFLQSHLAGLFIYIWHAVAWTQIQAAWQVARLTCCATDALVGGMAS